jgi:hypothetical protein
VAAFSCHPYKRSHSISFCNKIIRSDLMTLGVGLMSLCQTCPPERRFVRSGNAGDEMGSIADSQ